MAKTGHEGGGHGGGEAKAHKSPKMQGADHGMKAPKLKGSSLEHGGAGGIDVKEVAAQTAAAVGATVFGGYNIGTAFVGVTLAWEALVEVSKKLFGGGGGGGKY